MGPPASSAVISAVNPVVSMKAPDIPKIFTQQLNIVISYADLRDDRETEILSQVDPQYAFWTSIAHLHPQRTKWTLELIWAALRLALLVEMRFKHALACRRAIEYSPQVQPIILTPGHGSLPSGHSTEAHMVAYVLWNLLKYKSYSTKTTYRDPSWGEMLMRQASRIAINRTVAGVHFPVDSAAGQLLGLTLGEYFVYRCGGNIPPKAGYRAWRFDGTMYDPNGDFDWRDQYDVSLDDHTGSNFTALSNPNAPAFVPGTSPILSWLWKKAEEEWR